MAYIGLSDLHVAVYDPTLKTYETPVKLSPMASVKVTPNFTTTKMYGDNRIVHMEEGLGDINFEFSTTDLKSSEYELLLGKTKNADGVIVDSTTDQAPYVAIMFRMNLAGGGHQYYCYYQGKFQTPSTEGTTRGESTEFTPDTMTGIFIAREDAIWRSHCNSNDVGAEATAAAWFTQVYEEIVI